ncbi:flagellar hook-associated protein FlgK [Sphingobium subterraneum]|uniref:Flagellar hook-associated protein 1 n=1 Tax=Sphingobium subterraneum TaxID=627688 RepID=A0A841IYZ9_9SPHN|nr:flagellar hook-associated protein FlgK [Sphingobium subterraneum]MBB6123817.1 flagellar hook-associated protein 1 FlgK [Sphingobium subterraneum]
MSSADLFVIGSSGLKGYRAQMGAVSENIANSGTPNYNRRSVTLAESSLAASTEPFYVPRANFGGSVIVGVQRANDPYLDAAARMTGMSFAGADSRLRWLSDTETALNDDALGVGSSLGYMYSAVEKLAASPSDTSLRTNVLYGVEQVVTAFQQSSAALKSTLDGTYATAQGDVKLLNDSLTELARVNASLLQSANNTANQAQLLDSRDAELSKITQKLNVTITFGPGGSASVAYDGQNVVQGNAAGTFSVTQNTNGTMNLLLNNAAVAGAADGSLGGAFTSASIVKDRIASLDTLAVQFATDMNAWHAQGLTDTGAAGGPLVSVGTTASSLSVVLTDITKIAARSSDGRLNGNLLNISTTRSTSGVEQGWTALVVAHGNVLNTVKQEQAASQTRDQNARSAREKVSGVDLDMEAADLLRIQQAYQACAKVIQAARETIDSVLRIT